jgi:hypothetical protein
MMFPSSTDIELARAKMSGEVGASGKPVIINYSIRRNLVWRLVGFAFSQKFYPHTIYDT